MLYKILIIYFVIINLIAVILTVFDKSAARNGNWRISEKTLLIVSALGGSISMLTTMYIVHHKTKKMKFTIGLPTILISEIVLIIYFMFFYK